MKTYNTILADPPWAQSMTGTYRIRPNRAKGLPYPKMSVDEICEIPVAEFAAVGCHLWLWTTNEFLESGYRVMREWGFKYLAPIVWVKPSGVGNYFIHRTQTMLFGYKEKCVFPKARYVPNVFSAKEGEHSQKPKESYDLIESVSPEPRLELFARPITPMFPKAEGWDVWGNEVESDVEVLQFA